MKKLLLLSAALLVAGCGEKSSSEGSESASDSTIKKALEEAVEGDSLEERDGRFYQTNESEPYSGWVKMMYDSGQVKRLGKYKDGKAEGLFTEWHENGQKMAEITFKDGKENGLCLSWHENGQKQFESTYKDGKQHGLVVTWHENGQKQFEANLKDGKLVGSEKFWSSKGEEVETFDEADE